MVRRLHYHINFTGQMEMIIVIQSEIEHQSLAQYLGFNMSSNVRDSLGMKNVYQLQLKLFYRNYININFNVRSLALTFDIDSCNH